MYKYTLPVFYYMTNLRISTLIFTLAGIFSLTFTSLKAQSDQQSDSLQIYILNEINKVRIEANVDSVEVEETLYTVAREKSVSMAVDEAVSFEPGETASRMKKVKGTNKVDEIVAAIPVVKKSDPNALKEAARTIVQKWKTGKKEFPILSNGNHIYIGIAITPDELNKKNYISVVFGSFQSFNAGAKKKKELKVPYNKKGKKLQPPSEKACKNCDKFRDYVGLQKGLYLKDGKVYLKYDNLKAIKKLLKKPTDGFAVDIIQKDQYTPKDYNIYDNNLMTKGYMLKPMFKDKVFGSNKADDEDPKSNKLDICFGKFPKKLKGTYEMNLLVLQDKKVCKAIMPTYIEEGNQESATKFDMLLMPDSDAYMRPKYVIEAENSILTFIIPFEKNKYDYKEEDIKPILATMQEPDYIIEGLYVYAYSSIEGDSVSNTNLQKKRAESIIGTFKQMQAGKEIMTNVKTSDSWDLFKLEMEGGKFDELTKMKKQDAIRKINTTPGLAEELEPVLAKQRFAKVVMDITYDTKGPKEQKYAVAQFNKEVRKGNIKMAEKIQYFLNEKVQTGQYTPEALTTMVVPKEAKYSALLNNQVVYRYFANNKNISDEDPLIMAEISKLDPQNSYAAYNDIFCQIKAGDFASEKAIAETQSRIDQLYNTKIPKRFVDGLNTEFQFAVMEATDTLPNSDAITQACIEKIKGFYNFKEGSWQNNLKLAYVFMHFQDFKFAASVLEPFINNPKVDEQLLYTYVSCCAHSSEKTKGKLFVTAMKKIRDINPERFCVLVGAPNLTFQVLDNPFVKEQYQQANCK